MATHSSILAWKIPWTEGAWWAGYSPWDCGESDTTEVTEHPIYQDQKRDPSPWGNQDKQGPLLL